VPRDWASQQDFSVLLPRTVAMVLAGGQGQRLYPLTKRCAKPALRFAGCYRLIDFTLSNCLNSGLRRIYVLAQYAATSLLRHLRQGWTPLLPDVLGECLEVLPPQRLARDRWYAGTADAIYQNLLVLQQERPELVVLLSGDHVYKMDYRPMIAYHFSRQAVLTIATVPVPLEKARQLGVLQVDKQGRVRSFSEKPADPQPAPGRPGECLVNMGVYVWNTRTLARYVARDATSHSSHDFGKDIIPALLQAGEAVFAYEFTDPQSGRPAYWRDIGTLQSYWESHMDLLAPAPELDLYDASWPLYTARPPYPPAKSLGGDDTRLVDSLVCDGCLVAGRVLRSVLSPGVRIGEGAEVIESVLLDGVTVGPGARVVRAVVDEGLAVPPGFALGGQPERDRRRFVVTPEGLTVAPAGATFA
jgi:glucose-1-phosphate adenylyltransferase